MYFYGKSDVGRMRATNQDTLRTLWLYDNCCLLVVCDGMGGASGGNIASEIAAKCFTDSLQRSLRALPREGDRLAIDPDAARDTIAALLQNAAERANSAVWSRSLEDERLTGMGTTLVCALVLDTHLFVCNVGDSRLYRIDESGILRLTKDHSYLQYLLDSGQLSEEEAKNAPIRNIITRSLGTEERIEVDLYLSRLRGSGFLLLCSDGLSSSVEEEVIAETVLSPCLIRDVTDNDYELEDKVERLIELANEAGGSDNITALLLKYTDEDTEGGRL